MGLPAPFLPPVDRAPAIRVHLEQSPLASRKSYKACGPRQGVVGEGAFVFSATPCRRAPSPARIHVFSLDAFDHAREQELPFLRNAPLLQADGGPPEIPDANCPTWTVEPQAACNPLLGSFARLSCLQFLPSLFAKNPSSTTSRLRECPMWTAT